MVMPVRKPQSRFARMTLTACKVIYKALKLKGDVYHFHDPELLPWMLFLLLLRKRVVFDIHEHILSNVAMRPWVPNALRPIFHYVTKTAVRLLTPLFPIIFAERSYPSVYPWLTNFTVVCNFPKLGSFPGALQKESRFTIAYLGSITEKRGITDLLDAVGIVQKRGYDLGLLIIGREDFGTGISLADLIAERALNHVHVHAYTPQPDALKLVARCHVGFAVLRKLPNYINSYPTKLFEYMGCGLPVITSNFPLYASVIEKWQCGLLVNPEDPVALASKVLQLMENDALAHQMGERGKQAVAEEFNWSNEEYALLNFYRMLFDGPT